MANLHSRSNSLPSQSHPTIESAEDLLCRLKPSQDASTSATSVCADLATLKDLHRGINAMIQMPSVQQALSQELDRSWINELLEGSLELVDLCGFSRDVASLTKESVQNLESSIRRTTVDMNTYSASRKKINKMVNKCLKKLKSFNLSSIAIPDRGYDLKIIGMMLKETESFGLSTLKSALILLSGERERSSQTSRTILSKLIQRRRVHSEAEQLCGAEDLCSLNTIKSRKTMDCTTMINRLKQSEMTIQEVEEGLESLFRSLVETRVSLLNLLSF